MPRFSRTAPLQAWFVRLVVLAVLACQSTLSQAGELILLGEDGSVTVQLVRDTNQAPTVFKFGLPRIDPERRWREGSTVRAAWVTNGIHYTQTLLLTRLDAGQAGPSNRTNPVLLVIVEGANANSEYTEATAELVAEVDGERQELELSAGTVYRVEANRRVAIGMLEIPESGIRETRGHTLRFSGNMPPAMKGSMTLKVPLAPFGGARDNDLLRDLEVEGELRRALKALDPLVADPFPTRLELSKAAP